MEDLSGRSAVVTGAGSGIGRAIALRLAGAGAAVGLVGRTRSKLEEVASQCQGRATIATADVADRAALDAAFAEITSETGPLHAVVANAGTGGNNPEDGTDRWDEIVRTNLDGSYFSLRAFERHWDERDPDQAKHAIVISSCVARFGIPKISAYSAAKAGQLGMVRSLAAEWAPAGVRVNAICPGWVETDMAKERMTEIGADGGIGYSDARTALLGEVPLARISEPDEIARLVEFLLSPGGVGFTGQALDPNNGAWMG